MTLEDPKRIQMELLPKCHGGERDWKHTSWCRFISEMVLLAHHNVPWSFPCRRNFCIALLPRWKVDDEIRRYVHSRDFWLWVLWAVVCVWLTVDVVEASGLKFVLKIIASISTRVMWVTPAVSQPASRRILWHGVSTWRNMSILCCCFCVAAMESRRWDWNEHSWCNAVAVLWRDDVADFMTMTSGSVLCVCTRAV